MSQVMNLSLVTGPASLMVRRRAVGSIPAMVMLRREGSVGRWNVGGWFSAHNFFDRAPQPSRTPGFELPGNQRRVFSGKESSCCHHGGVGQALPRGGDGQVPGGGVEVGGEHLGVQGVV